MDENQDNSTLDSSSDKSSTEINTTPQEKTFPLSDQLIESDQEDHANKNSNLEKKGTIGKSWLLFLVLFTILGVGFYSYTHTKGDDFSSILSENLKKLSSAPPKIKKPLDSTLNKTPFSPNQEVIKEIEEASSPSAQSKEIPANPLGEFDKGKVIKDMESVSSTITQTKEMPAKPSEEIVEQTPRPNPLKKTINEKTIDLLRNEIQSLRSELKEKASIPQKFQTKRPHISGGFSEKESTSEIILPIASSLDKTNLQVQQNHSQKISSQRSKEVQAYLDFIENTGRRLIEGSKEGLARLKVLVVEFVEKY